MLPTGIVKSKGGGGYKGYVQSEGAKGCLPTGIVKSKVGVQKICAKLGVLPTGIAKSKGGGHSIYAKLGCYQREL